MTREIPLSQGLVALVDDEDYERVTAAGKWITARGRNTSYAYRQRRARGRAHRETTYLHCFLLGRTFVDHVNGNGLDNRRANLRPATHAENQQNRGLPANNTSGFKGVSWDKARRTWRAQIKITARRASLGSYPTAEEAARAYDEAAREHFGEFAWLNFPEGAVR